MPASSKGKPERVSLRALGRRLDVSLMAVQKAIRSGRLRRSIGRDARGPFVANVALAEQEWRSGATKPANGGGKGHAPATGTLVEAQLRLTAQRSDALELANRRKRGEVHDVVACQREQFEVARMLRQRILNVPDRLADLEASVRARIREELRLALGNIAEELERG